MSKRKKILWGLLVVLVIIQFFRIDKSKPEYPPQNDFLVIEQAPQQVAEIFKNACYDCHSFETKYPWYTNIAPVSWWIKGHIKGGRQNLNFSEWGTYDGKKRSHKLEETVEEVSSRHMPMKSYTFLHPKAKLIDQDINSLVDWVKSKMPQ